MLINPRRAQKHMLVYYRAGKAVQLGPKPQGGPSASSQPRFNCKYLFIDFASILTKFQTDTIYNKLKEFIKINTL
jgi:hypothetical protein